MSTLTKSVVSLFLPLSLTPSDTSVHSIPKYYAQKRKRLLLHRDSIIVYTQHAGRATEKDTTGNRNQPQPFCTNEFLQLPFQRVTFVSFSTIESDRDRKSMAVIGECFNPTTGCGHLIFCFIFRLQWQHFSR